MPFDIHLLTLKAPFDEIFIDDLQDSHVGNPENPAPWLRSMSVLPSMRRVLDISFVLLKSGNDSFVFSFALFTIALPLCYQRRSLLSNPPLLFSIGSWLVEQHGHGQGLRKRNDGEPKSASNSI